MYNRENDVELSPDSNGFINYPADALRIDASDNSFDRTTNIVKREGKLYDKVHKSYVFNKAIKVNFIRIYDFDDLPSVFQRYITARASSRAATQLVANPQFVQLLGQQEAFAVQLAWNMNAISLTLTTWDSLTIHLTELINHIML